MSTKYLTSLTIVATMLVLFAAISFPTMAFSQTAQNQSSTEQKGTYYLILSSKDPEELKELGLSLLGAGGANVDPNAEKQFEQAFDLAAQPGSETAGAAGGGSSGGSELQICTKLPFVGKVCTPNIHPGIPGTVVYDPSG
jgi:hypothetical protein